MKVETCGMVASISASYFRRTFSVSLTTSWPSSGACSSTSTRAQSMVSLTDGSFFRSSVRTSWMKLDHLLAQMFAKCRAPGFRRSALPASARGSRYADAGSAASARRRDRVRCSRSGSRSAPRPRQRCRVPESSPGNRLRISSSSDSNSASDLSISSISSTQPAGCSSACSSGRGSTNSLEKNTSPKS